MDGVARAPVREGRVLGGVPGAKEFGVTFDPNSETTDPCSERFRAFDCFLVEKRALRGSPFNAKHNNALVQTVEPLVLLFLKRFLVRSWGTCCLRSLQLVT